MIIDADGKYTRDYICKKCNIRVFKNDTRYYYIINYIDDVHAGLADEENEVLSCNECIIKNIIE